MQNYTNNMDNFSCWFCLVNYTWFAIMVHKSGAFFIGRNFSFLTPGSHFFAQDGWRQLLVFKIHHRQKKTCSQIFFSFTVSILLSFRLVKAKSINENFLKIANFCQSFFFSRKIDFHCFSFCFFGFNFQPVQMMSFGGKMRRPFQSCSYELFQAGTFKV